MAGMDESQPFADIRVVEFGQYVSVPFCAQLLAEGGADVIKVEQLTGDPTRLLRQISPLVTRTFLSRNRGKRSLPLALRDPSAQPVIDRLLAWADVVLMNFRPGLDVELGLDPATLNERYPRLIAASSTTNMCAMASANGMFHRLHHADAGDFTVLSPPVRMNGEGFRSRSASRKFATETRAILRELSFAESEIDDLISSNITRVEA